MSARQIRRYGGYFLTLMALALAGSACGAYILLKQRLPDPFQRFYHVTGEFPSAAAVVPGLGEPVNLAGVHVGEITGTSLHGGTGLIQMQIDPRKIPGGHLYRNARADLVPNTPLDDMEVDLAPGTKSAGALPSGGAIPVGQTTSPTNSDDLLDSLDTDTRTWLSSLITEIDNGTEGRAADIRRLMDNLGPTATETGRLFGLLATRRRRLATLVHHLGTLAGAAAGRDSQVGRAIDAGDTTIAAIARQDVALRSAIAELPATLQVARGTLSGLTRFADGLGPAATALLPTARRLPQTLRDTNTLVNGAAVLPLKQIPAFERAVLPLATPLAAIGTTLTRTLPPLTATFQVLHYVANEIAYDPGGTNPGFLYWLGWFAHNANSFMTSDANGPAWRVLILTDCATLRGFSFAPLLESVAATNFGC